MMLGKNHNSYSTANLVNTYREEINQLYLYESKRQTWKEKKWHPYVEPVEWKLFNNSTNSHKEATNVHDYRAC
jgi:hypothetical protein